VAVNQLSTTCLLCTVQCLVSKSAFICKQLVVIKWHTNIAYSILIEGLRERTEYIDVFLFSAHHSIVFCFR